jgi:hypothetical protein
LPKEVLEGGIHPEDVQLTTQSVSPVMISTTVDRVLEANRTHGSLKEYREKARHDEGKWQLQDGLLLREEKLMVPEDGDLRARLLDEIHR